MPNVLDRPELPSSDKRVLGSKGSAPAKEPVPQSLAAAKRVHAVSTPHRFATEPTLALAAFSRASHYPGLVLWPAIGVPPERRGGPMTDRLGKCCREAAGGRRGDDEPSKIATGGVG